MVTLGVDFDLLQDLVQVDFAEGVAAAGDHHQFLVSGHAIQAVERVIHRVEDVGLGPSRDTQQVQRAEDGLLVLGEVHQNVGLHVELDHGYPILRLQGGSEDIGVVERVHHEVVVGGGELHQQHRRDGRLALGHGDDLLLTPSS
jgi:hypothetical protein